ncbi:MAG: cbb3-type cytochrome oxidase assembly protein CcoS [Ekhidna sp.]
MSVIFILIACSLLLAGGFLGAFLWASKAGQFEDDYTPSVRMLFEDEPSPEAYAKRETLISPNQGKESTTIKPSIHVQ